MASLLPGRGSRAASARTAEKPGQWRGGRRDAIANVGQRGETSALSTQISGETQLSPASSAALMGRKREREVPLAADRGRISLFAERSLRGLGAAGSIERQRLQPRLRLGAGATYSPRSIFTTSQLRRRPVARAAANPRGGRRAPYA